MDPSEYKTIIYEPGVITKIIHNEPDIRNALNGHFILEFVDALRRFQRNREAAVAVVMSKGTIWSAGHDLRYVSKMGEWKPSEPKVLDERDWREQMEFMRDNLYLPLWDCHKPLIAAVQGDAHAGGAEIIFTFDIIVMNENANLVFREMRVSGTGSGDVMPFFLGWNKATEIYLTGGAINARELERLGGINKAVPPDQVEAEAMRYAKILSIMPAEYLKLRKQSIRFSQNNMGARNAIWFAGETNILGHLNRSPREAEFYATLKEKGMRTAIEGRDKPFKELGA